MNDPAAREEFLMTEMSLANQELIQGFYKKHFAEINPIIYSQAMFRNALLIWSILLPTLAILRLH